MNRYFNIVLFDFLKRNSNGIEELIKLDHLRALRRIFHKRKRGIVNNYINREQTDFFLNANLNECKQFQDLI